MHNSKGEVQEPNASRCKWSANICRPMPASGARFERRPKHQRDSMPPLQQCKIGCCSERYCQRVSHSHHTRIRLPRATKLTQSYGAAAAALVRATWYIHRSRRQTAAKAKGTPQPILVLAYLITHPSVLLYTAQRLMPSHGSQSS